jgi:hypothetical protein
MGRWGHGGTGRRSGLKIPSPGLHPCRLPPAERFPVSRPGLAGMQQKSACLLSLHGGVCLAEASTAQLLQEQRQEIQAQETSRAKHRRWQASGRESLTPAGCARVRGWIKWRILYPQALPLQCRCLARMMASLRRSVTSNLWCRAS